MKTFWKDFLLFAFLAGMTEKKREYEFSSDHSLHGFFNIDTPKGMENAVKWQLKLFSTIRDGGVWIVPRSGTAYTVHHAKKTVVRRLGFAPEPTIERVIKAAGWTVLAMTRMT